MVSGRHRRRRRSPCTHGRPATFQPATVRWCSASCGPSKPSLTLYDSVHPAAVAASAAAMERTPTDRGSTAAAGPLDPGGRQLVDEAVVEAAVRYRCHSTRTTSRPSDRRSARRTTTRRGSARRRARLAGPARDQALGRGHAGVAHAANIAQCPYARWSVRFVKATDAVPSAHASTPLRLPGAVARLQNRSGPSPRTSARR